jgi:competence protein ComEC
MAAEQLNDQFRQEAEQRRTFLWVPVIYSAGILAYYQLPREPSLTALVLFAAILSVIAAFRFARNRTFRIWALIAIMASGAATAKIRTGLLDTPMVMQPAFGLVHGTVAAVQERSGRPPRVILDNPHFETRRRIETPRRIRVSLLKSDRIPTVGQTIALRARLGPVPGPAMPGGYDPRRAAFFDGIAASGFALGKWQVQSGSGISGMHVFAAIGIRIEAFRQVLVRRILDNVPGTAGAVAVALLVGERGHIPTETVQNLRDAGLAHILAISGLHMALFAGTVFVFARALLALSASLSLNWPIKKWAAIAALFAAFIYLLLSGGNVATLRAFIMAAIMFGAVLVDRPALSLRNLAIAALVILAFEPESVTEPGFQMSFAAVAALIAFYEAWRERPRLNLAEPPATLPGRLVFAARRNVGAIAMTTIIAGFATGPIAAFHFNHVALYSLFGNLLAIPLLTLIVMPFGLLSLVLMPFGLEGWPLSAMATGMVLILDIAAAVSGREGATFLVSSASPAVYLLYLTGFLWLCLWRLRWRWLGLVPVVAASLAAFIGHDRPDILISNTGTMVAVRDASGALRVSAKRPNRFVLEQWFRREGLTVPEREEFARDVRCDRDACLVALPGGGVLAHIRTAAAFAEECRRASIIVTKLDAPQNCGSDLVIDKGKLAQSGAHIVNVRPRQSGAGPPVHDYRVRTAYQPVRRPWQGRTGHDRP